MRQVKEFSTANGKRYRVRYRLAGRETSETFINKRDAQTFAAIMGDARDPAQVADALAWLHAQQSDREVATFATWFEKHVDELTGIQSRTRDDYRAMRRRYLGDLNNLPLPLITRTHVTSLVNELEARGLSPKTIKNVVHMLSSVMAHALDEGHITRNPVRRIRLPKAGAETNEPKFLTAAEFGALFEAIDPHYRPLITFLVGTGLRWSEATALQGRHVDLEAGTVRVERAWKRVSGGWEIGPPKSDASRRTVNAASLGLAAAAHVMRRPSDLLFTTPRGNVVRHANFYNRVWRPACLAADLDPAPSPHDLRHSFASWSLSEGTPLEAVQDQLGHESYETTRKVYAHLMPAVGVAAGKAASAALARALPDGVDFARLAVKAGGRADHPTDP